MVSTARRTTRALGIPLLLMLAWGAAGCEATHVATRTQLPGPPASVLVTTPAAQPPSVRPTESAAGTAAPSTPAARPTPNSPSAAARPVVAATPGPNDALQSGAKGPAVVALQERLAALGYWNGAADGTFGDLTQQAVYALQKAAGLGRDGVVGPTTKTALANGVRPRIASSGSGHRIEINKATQLLLILDGSKITTILNTSTGSGKYYNENGSSGIATTPSGSFHVFREVNHEDVGPLGALWRPKYFNRGIAVHGLAFVPPYPASHGCTRVSIAAMDMIWAQGLLPIGTAVTVV